MSAKRGLDEAGGLFPIEAPNATPNSPLGAEGHRARMRKKLIEAGPSALLDHELIEMVLFLALPRRDTKPLAKLLLARFGSFAAALTASTAELRAIEGLGEAGIAALRTVQAAALRLGEAAVRSQPLLSDSGSLAAYLTAAMARERTEHFRVLFLDVKNRLIADEVMGRGTVDHTPAYPREVVRRALELHASSLILAHNHPSGDPTPSPADIAMTRDIKAAAAALGIALHDHLVVGRGAPFSMRGQGLL
ncbi:JAB domain-containing protein [Roseococcus sp. SYP-B2431]|uniref:RadC family protein n=1 Tax=Roseococcus sp. SYP-B2431 TaxID=2496640 RepID=UPI001040C97C|nr:DNA repair protein RadC [Roseococcus sp. SYP-B2431]TCH98570.1 JAB domain-containing protein [Roseococcus sp. SYP-B2431]